MMMTGGFMVFYSLFFTFLFLGFAYIVWTTAGEEKDIVKYIGQTISVVIAVLAILGFLYSSIYGGALCKNKMMTDKTKMMNHMMMKK